MVYRPTVRYADEFKSYVDNLFQATTLDRNQIMRAALFTAAFSPNFLLLMKEFKKADVLLPSPVWQVDQHGFWMEKDPSEREGGKDANVIDRRTRSVKGTIETDQLKKGGEEKHKLRRQQSIQGREGEIPARRIRTNQGGITIRIGETERSLQN